MPDGPTGVHPFGRVAIVHEWLVTPGGSEKVVESLLDMFPEADVFCSLYDRSELPASLASRPLHATFLQRVPRAARIYPRLLPLMPAAVRRLDLSGYDLVVSSSHACAVGAPTARLRPRPVHVCYCHTPMRYAWDPAFLEGELTGIALRAARLMVPWLRSRDRRASLQPDAIAANSSVVADRIAQHWGRASVVVPPPVEVDRFEAVASARGADPPYLVFGRVVPYKRVADAVQACERLGAPLRVAGDGRDLDRVRRLSNGRTEFLGRVADDEVPGLFATSRALLFPGVEDFGIVPVEAQACGLPVVANGLGGVRDSVVDGRTGVLYEVGAGDPVQALVDAIASFESTPFDDATIRASAQRFTPSRFQDAMSALIADARGRRGSG